MQLTQKKIRNRRAIARDVVKQIKARAYRAETQVYANSMALQEALTDGGAGCELQTIVKSAVRSGKPCRVCGIGSAFLSAIRLYDAFKINRTEADYGQIDNDRMYDALKEYFTRSELCLIEASFEVESAFFRNELFRLDFEKATKYIDFLAGNLPEQRLTWIMETVDKSAAKPITLQVLKDAMLRSLLSDSRFKQFRKQNGY